MRELYEYRKSWRRTKMGAITYPIAYCSTCGVVVEPARMTASKVGTHGEFIFKHEHPLSFIILLESNTGKRDVMYEPEVRDIAEEIKSSWRAGASVEEVKELLRNIKVVV